MFGEGGEVLHVRPCLKVTICDLKMASSCFLVLQIHRFRACEFEKESRAEILRDSVSPLG